MKAGRNQQVIMRLFEAVSNNDRDRVLSFFSHKSRLQTLLGTEVVGQEAIWNTIDAAKRDVEEVDWHIDQLDEDDTGVVRTAGKLRCLKNGCWHEYPFSAAFEVCGSKVMQLH